MKKFDTIENTTKTAVTPKGVIMLALGGYSNPQAKELAEKVEAALAKHMADHHLELVQGRQSGNPAPYIRFFGKNA